MFDILLRALEQADAVFEPDVLGLTFSGLVLQLPAQQLSARGFQVFHELFRQLNALKGALDTRNGHQASANDNVERPALPDYSVRSFDLLGRDQLWRLALQGNGGVARHAGYAAAAAWTARFTSSAPPSGVRAISVSVAGLKTSNQLFAAESTHLPPMYTLRFGAADEAPLPASVACSCGEDMGLPLCWRNQPDKSGLSGPVSPGVSVSSAVRAADAVAWCVWDERRGKDTTAWPEIARALRTNAKNFWLFLCGLC